MNSQTRRQALQTLAASTATVALGANSFGDEQKAPGIRIGLSQYSLRQLFASGELNVMDYPKFARDTFGITEIDVWEGGMPADKQNQPEFLKELRQRATDGGSSIFLWMTNPVDCTKTAPAERKAEADKFHRPVDNAAVLGCRYVRIFVKAPDIDRKDSVAACADTLTPLADYAHDYDMTLAIEPAASKLTRDGSFLAELMRAMKHDHCQLMPDFGKLGGDIYAGNAAMLPWTVVVSAKSHNFDTNGDEEKFDYHRLIGDVKASGFKGIIAIEYEGSKLGPVEGVKATQTLLTRCLKEG